MIEQEILLRTVNEYNTPLDDRYYVGLSRDIVDDIHASIDEILFVKRLLSPNIKSATDIEKDEDGKPNMNNMGSTPTHGRAKVLACYQDPLRKVAGDEPGTVRFERFIVIDGERIQPEVNHEDSKN